MVCPGSPRMTRGLPKEDSPYAAKGTLEHKLSCICLSEDREARHAYPQKVAGP